ncbi:hypothetical protein F5I97DRAFT_1831888 [Phlebopus sp. FC_14]|nr:hypothetical protein F5I97DRAFT_1831888 [Phlebopus sp. FC_14]
MHNSASPFFTAEDKRRHPYLSSVLETSTQKVIATAAARVYYAPFINPHLNWSYSKLKGILVFGRDREALAGTPPPDSGPESLRSKEKYWFRLVDIKMDRVVWTFSIPEVFEYKQDKPFFHYFSGTVLKSQVQTRMFGFCFDEDEEAGVFWKKVVDRTQRHSVLRPFRNSSMSKPKTKAKSPVSPRIISSPTPHSFVHVSHVGISTKGIIESSKNIEPAWSSLIADLQHHGVPPDVVSENMDFVEGFLAGAMSMRDKGSLATKATVPGAPSV